MPGVFLGSFFVRTKNEQSNESPVWYSYKWVPESKAVRG